MISAAPRRPRATASVSSVTDRDSSLRSRWSAVPTSCSSALIRQTAHHVPRKDEEPRPGDQGGDGLLGESRLHPQSLDHLEEEHEHHDEDACEHREAAPAEESRQDDGEIIEAQECELLVDQVIDAKQRCDEQDDEDALEVPEEELLRALYRTRLNHCWTSERGTWGARGNKVGNRRADCKVRTVTIVPTDSLSVLAYVRYVPVPTSARNSLKGGMGTGRRALGPAPRRLGYLGHHALLAELPPRQ